MAAIELGIPYYIYNPAGSQYFALNAPSDSGFVGYVTDITGIDGAGVRENAQVVVAGDGGHHGPFWKDRRPWTLSGIILPIFPLLARDQSQEKIEGILDQAFRSDGYMLWTPADGIQKRLNFRIQQPVRISTGQSKVEKTFQLACVSADWRVLSSTQHSVQASGVASSGLSLPTVTNAGNVVGPVKFGITGPINYFYVYNVTTGKRIWVNLNVSAGTGATIDLTGAYPSVTTGAGSVYGSVDPLQTDWDMGAAPGANTFQLVEVGNPAGSGFTSNGSTTLAVYWNDAWS